MRIETFTSSFGKVAIATQDSKLVGVTFGDPNVLIEHLRRYKNYIIDDSSLSPDVMNAALDSINNNFNFKLNIHLFGTPFQVQVWEELRNIPSGDTRTYQEIANRIGRPNSVRAVANAVGANQIAIIVPCHRVIRSDGSLGGYRWGKEMKRKLLAREER